MNKEDIEITLLDDSEIDEVNLLYNSSYGTGRTREKFLWEFYNAPAGKAIFVVAKDKITNKIVGTQSAIPIDVINSSGEIIRTAKSEDTLVDPNYRGLSIFERMYDKLFEECKNQNMLYIWGFTPARKPFLKIGFEIPFDHSQSLLVRDIGTSIRHLSTLHANKNLSTKLKLTGLCLWSKLSGAKRKNINKKIFSRRFSFSVTDRSGLRDMSSLAQKSLCEKKELYMINKSLAYLNWRLKDNPFHKQIFNVVFSESGGDVANVVFNHYTDGIWYLVYDIYSSALSEGDKTQLLKKAIDLLVRSEGSNVKLIRTWDFAHNGNNLKEINVRMRAGMIHLERGVGFVWKNLDSSGKLKAESFVLSRISSQGVI